MKETIKYEKSQKPYIFQTEVEHGKRIDFAFILYIFCLIFAPPLLPKINFLVVVFIYSSYKLVTVHKKDFKEIYLKSGVLDFVKRLIISVYYIVIIMLLNIILSNDFYINNYFITIYRLLILIPMQLVCVVYIISKCKKEKISTRKLLSYFAYAGVLQSVIGIITLLMPSVKQVLIEIMSKNTENDVFFSVSAYSSGDTYRYYGFAASLLDTFGYGTGIIVTISIFLAFYYSTKYLWLVPITLVAPILNSRTGILICLIGLLFSVPLLLIKIDKRKMINISIFSFIMVLIMINAHQFLKIYSPTTILWITRGIGNLFSFLTGNESKYFEVTDVLFSENFWTFPEGIKLLFGSGHTVYGLTSALGFHSDVGYVNHVWLAGLAGTTLLYFPFIAMFYSALRKSQNKMLKLLVFFLAIAFFVTMIKGDLISYNAGIVTTFTICFYTLYIGHVKVDY